MRTLEPGTVRVLSIDAWRDPDGWQWNNWHDIGAVALPVCDMRPRAMLRALRDAGFLSPHATGRVAVEDDQYNVVIVARGTREPLIALAYGELQT